LPGPEIGTAGLHISIRNEPGLFARAEKTGLYKVTKSQSYAVPSVTRFHGRRRAVSVRQGSTICWKWTALTSEAHSMYLNA
jgi:hypothetical protein